MLRSLVTTTAIAGVVMSGALPASAATPSSSLPTNTQNHQTSFARQSDNETATPCPFITRGDYVHVTRGEASAHGWWEKGTCAAKLARVRVQLQQHDGKRWRNVGRPGDNTIPPGTGKRANARAKCKNANPSRWRIIVDVDLVGQADSPDKLYTETPGKVHCSAL